MTSYFFKRFDFINIYRTKSTCRLHSNLFSKTFLGFPFRWWNLIKFVFVRYLLNPSVEYPSFCLAISLFKIYTSIKIQPSGKYCEINRDKVWTSLTSSLWIVFPRRLIIYEIDTYSFDKTQSRFSSGRQYTYKTTWNVHSRYSWLRRLYSHVKRRYIKHPVTKLLSKLAFGRFDEPTEMYVIDPIVDYFSLR